MFFTEKELPSVMGSEDFHHLVIHNTKKNYCYLNIGTADPAKFEKSWKEKQTFPFNAHNGDFEVDLNAIPYGAKVGSISLLSIFDHYKTN